MAGMLCALESMLCPHPVPLTSLAEPRGVARECRARGRGSTRNRRRRAPFLQEPAQGAKQAQIIRADADATASRIYAESFGKDPDFYDFYRAMQSYRVSFGTDGNEASGGSSVILSPDNEYLKQFRGRRE